MARASLTQHAFNAGELSPLLLGRQDIEQYAKSLYTCFNAQVLTQGAWTRRPGSLFLWNTRYSGAQKSRLVPFRYSITQAYMLEISAGFARFYLNHGLLTGTANTITGITKANPAVLTYTGTDPTNGTRMLISGITGMTQLNNVEVIVTSVNTGAKTFQLNDVFNNPINSSNFTAYTSGGTAAPIIELGMPYAKADLPDIRWTQSDDTLYLFHPNYAPQIVTRTSATSFSLANMTFTDGPYDVENTTATTLTPSGTTGSITITASSTTGINNGSGFLSTDVGRLIRISNGTGSTTWGYVSITAVNSTTSVTATVQSALGATTATANWRLGIWSNTTGWPVCGLFYQNRLAMAGAKLYSQRFDLSESGQYYNFNPSATDGTVADNNAISFQLFASEINTIHWMSNHYMGLLIGTETGAWVVTPSTTSQSLTPSNVNAQLANGYGSIAIDPFLIDRAVMYVERGALKLRELSFVYMVNGFEAPDMSLLAPQASTTGFVEMQFQSLPTPTLWFTRNDGVLVGFTYMRDNNVMGWHRHELGGVSNSTGSPSIVENICVLPTSDGTADELYAVVQRYVNGKTVRYIEVLTPLWQNGDDQTLYLGADSGTTINFGVGQKGTAITGLNWLEGQTVGVLTDGSAHPDCVVTSGTITLDVAANIAQIGLRFNSIGQTMPVEGGSQDGSAQGKLKRIERIGLWLMDTLGLSVGPDANTLTEIIERQWGSNFGSMVPLFTGIWRDRFEGDWDRLGQVYWQASGMFPATVLAMMEQLQVSDET